VKHLLLTTIAAVLLVGCGNEPKHVSGAKFQGEYRMGIHQTMHQSEYIGEKDGKFYLRRKSMSLLNKRKWNEEIWYTKAEELEPSFLEQLRKEAKTSEELKAEGK
jgi:hypothetical protein